MNYVNKSLAILKGLGKRNGAILATFENDAYPYVYPRDAVVITKALNASGLYKNSKKFYYFISQFVRNGEVFQRYDKFGRPFVSKKGENDCTGMLLDGIYNTFSASYDQDFIRDMWPLVNACVNFLAKKTRNGLIYTERSIHEFFRLENGYEIWANSACCRGLYSASEIAKILTKKKEAKKWGIRADNLKKNIKKRLFDKNQGVFIKKIKGVLRAKLTAPDISQLAPFYFDIIEPGTILKRTLKLLRHTLWNEKLGGFNRFRKFEVCKDWHWYDGGDGPWFYTIWCAKFYKMIGDEKGHDECLRWMEKVITPKGFFPEHISLKSSYNEWVKNELEFNPRIVLAMKRAEKFKPPLEGVMYWATPLGWANAELILCNKFLK